MVTPSNTTSSDSGGSARTSPTAKRALVYTLLSPVFCIVLFFAGAFILWIGLMNFLQEIQAGDFLLVLLIVWLLVLPAVPGLLTSFKALGEIRRNPGMAGKKRAILALLLTIPMGVVNYCIGALGMLVWAADGLHGRRFRVKGRAKTARTEAGQDWSVDLQPRTETLDALTREALAEAWLEDARAEHASIAAFSRLGLELMAAGAPPRLLEQTHQAALDEVRHAQACFTLAGAYRGEALGPAAFPQAVEPARQNVPTSRQAWLEVLATDSLVDGCLGEGYAASAAALAGSRATEPAVLKTLGAICSEEARHAELGWDVLAWCLREGGESVRQALKKGLADLELNLPRSLPAAGVSVEALAAHGRLHPDLQHQVRDQAVEAVRQRALSLLEAGEIVNGKAA